MNAALDTPREWLAVVPVAFPFASSTQVHVAACGAGSCGYRGGTEGDRLFHSRRPGRQR